MTNTEENGGFRSRKLSIVSEQTFFEGAEKLLEVWFTPTRAGQSLRVIPREEWERLLDTARCQIISTIANDYMDSYVLSESSMFVSDNRYILKTCGTTRLMDTVEELLKLAKKYCGWDQITNIFYSRKNFVRPELQSARHRSFDAEVDHLDRYFSDGAAYCMGRLNQDRWYLYTLNPPRGPINDLDQTLEILMSDLDPAVMRIFTMKVSSDGQEATKLSGIDKLLPENTKIDDKLFEPCGYSMNGILEDTDQYVTIHITPEPDFSYVSFETNMNQASFFQQICRVLSLFKPGRFLMTLFANEASDTAQNGQKQLWEKSIPGFARKDLQFLHLPEKQTLVYAQYKLQNDSQCQIQPMKAPFA